MPHILNLKQPQTAEITDVSETAKDIIEWTAAEFDKHKKEPGWYLIGLIIIVLLLGAAILLKSILFALIIILASLAIYIYSLKEPRQIHFKATGQGIQIDKTLYPYTNLKSFWLFYDPPDIKYLSIESKKLMLPYIKIPLGEQDPTNLREFLIKFIPEKQQDESFIDIIARRLRF